MGTLEQDVQGLRVWRDGVETRFAALEKATGRAVEVAIATRTGGVALDDRLRHLEARIEALENTVAGLLQRQAQPAAV